MHFGAITSFLAMRDAAARDGIDLRRGLRIPDFDRQLAIWNAKWRGERPLLSATGARSMRPRSTTVRGSDAILCWSGLPRQRPPHWGSDVDVIDVAAMPEGYRVQLVSSEYAPGAVFARLTPWLDANMGRFGFYRPYASGTAAQERALAPELLPVAQEALESLTLPVLRRAIAGSGILGRETVLERLPEDLYAICHPRR